MLWFAVCGLQVVSCKLQVARCEAQITLLASCCLLGDSYCIYVLMPNHYMPIPNGPALLRECYGFSL